MFQGILHSHLAGRKMTLRHIRNQQELPTLLEDKNYDFNYQYIKNLPEKERQLLPGDELILECDYSKELRAYVYKIQGLRKQLDLTKKHPKEDNTRYFASPCDYCDP